MQRKRRPDRLRHNRLRHLLGRRNLFRRRLLHYRSSRRLLGTRFLLIVAAGLAIVGAVVFVVAIHRTIAVFTRRHTKVLPQLVRHIVINGAGMRQLLCYAKFGQ